MSELNFPVYRRQNSVGYPYDYYIVRFDNKQDGEIIETSGKYVGSWPIGHKIKHVVYNCEHKTWVNVDNEYKTSVNVSLDDSLFEVD